MILQIFQRSPHTIFAMFSAMMASASCNAPEQPDSGRRTFRKPYLIRPGRHDTAGIGTDRLTEMSPFFAGKYSFRDTLIIARSEDRDSLDERDYQSNVLSNADSPGGAGFEIVPDFHPRGEKPGRSFVYPVYLVNESASTKIFQGKDGYVFGLQEALDSTGVWRPIECRGFDFCGNGRWQMHVRPGEFVTVFFLRYSGGYKTKLRVRLRNGDNIYLSKSFDGSINPGQFLMRKEGYVQGRWKEDKAGTIQTYFYGAIPVDVEP